MIISCCEPQSFALSFHEARITFRATVARFSHVICDTENSWQGNSSPTEFTADLNTKLSFRSLKSFTFDNYTQWPLQHRSRKVSYTSHTKSTPTALPASSAHHCDQKSRHQLRLNQSNTNNHLQAPTQRSPPLKPAPQQRPPSRAFNLRKPARSDSQPPSTDQRPSNSADPQNTHESRFLMSPVSMPTRSSFTLSTPRAQ